MTRIASTNILRADLKATLNDRGDSLRLTIERILTPEAKISLKADEWQELMDWTRAITLLHKENSNRKNKVAAGGFEPPTKGL